MDFTGPLPSFELGDLRFLDTWVLVEMQPGKKTSYDSLIAFRRVGIDIERAALEFELPGGMRRATDGRVELPSPGEFPGVLLAATAEGRPPHVRAVMAASGGERRKVMLP